MNPPQATWGLPARLGILVGLFLVEVFLASVWLDARVLRGRGPLAMLLHDWGAWSVRLVVATVLGSLIFAESRARSDLQRISQECRELGIRWQGLAGHACAMLLFVELSSLLFSHDVSSTMGNILTIAWGLTGVASLVLAACALVPPRIWTAIFRSTGDAWIYGFAAALAACVLAILSQRLWLPLSHSTLRVVATMMRPFVPVLTVDPATMTIESPAFQITIAPECSGYEGMGLLLAFSSAWLWFFRRQWRFPQALLLIPASVALIWLANAVRIAGLFLIGNAGWPQIAVGGFHSQAGWMAFNAVAIGTCILARRIPALARPDGTDAGVVESNPTAPYLMPFLAVLAAGMIARGVSADFEWFYFLRIVAALGAVWFFRSSYRNLDFRFSWLGIVAGAVVFALWIALEPSARSAEPSALAHASNAARSSWIAARVVGAVLIVPIAEELAFRGFLLRRLVSADFESISWRAFSWAPLLISSVAFGILHGDRWVVGTIAGVIFALAQIRKGRIGEAIAAHAVANALVAAWVLGAGAWQLW